MKITKRDSVASKLPLHEFGRAMAELDLASIPPENRNRALMDHMVHIMIGTITDNRQRDELIAAWLKHKANRS